MAISVKFDMLNSTLTKSFLSPFRNRAVRRFVVRDPGNPAGGTIQNREPAPFGPGLGGEDLNASIDLIKVLIGDFHPSFVELPLSHISAERMGPEKVLVTAFYVVFGGGGGGGDPTASFNTAITTAHWPVAVYRSSFLHDGQGPAWDVIGSPIAPPAGEPPNNDTGLPFGDIHNVPNLPAQQSQNVRPQERMWNRPVIQISAFVTLNFNPYGSEWDIGQYVDKINTGTVSFGDGSTLPGEIKANAIRFDGADIIETFLPNLGPRFLVTYNWSVIEGKFWHQELLYFDPNLGWIVRNRPAYQAVNMGGAFPSNFD